jgi:nanoRNase/pAp phosphatase (c-di-AMP/oligoRNAs hydrolase)
MINKTVQILIAVVAVVAAAGWYHASEALHDERVPLVSSTLASIARLVREDQEIIRELQGGPFSEPNRGVLQSYLVKIRRDGVAQTAQMKQRLDQLAENNTTLAALITAYLPYARTTTFAVEANRFRNYAVGWRDRWNSVMELFMAGGDYPAAGVAFPSGFAEAVRAELAAIR